MGGGEGIYGGRHRGKETCKLGERERGGRKTLSLTCVLLLPQNNSFFLAGLQNNSHAQHRRLLNFKFYNLFKLYIFNCKF